MRPEDLLFEVTLPKVENVWFEDSAGIKLRTLKRSGKEAHVLVCVLSQGKTFDPFAHYAPDADGPHVEFSELESGADIQKFVKKFGPPIRGTTGQTRREVKMKLAMLLREVERFRVTWRLWEALKEKRIREMRILLQDGREGPGRPLPRCFVDRSGEDEFNLIEQAPPPEICHLSALVIERALSMQLRPHVKISSAGVPEARFQVRDLLAAIYCMLILDMSKGVKYRKCICGNRFAPRQPSQRYCKKRCKWRTKKQRVRIRHREPHWLTQLNATLDSLPYAER